MHIFSPHYVTMSETVVDRIKARIAQFKRANRTNKTAIGEIAMNKQLCAVICEAVERQIQQHLPDLSQEGCDFMENGFNLKLDTFSQDDTVCYKIHIDRNTTALRAQLAAEGIVLLVFKVVYNTYANFSVDVEYSVTFGRA